MAHTAGHASPYGELFDLPTGGDISSWDNPTAEDIAKIQQDPNLQLQYVMNLYTEGIEEAGDPAGLHIWRPGTGHKLGLEELIGYFEQSESLGDFVWAGMEEEDLRSELKDFSMYVNPEQQWATRKLDPESRETSLSWLLDLAKGMGKLGTGDTGIDALTRELGLLEKEVTGPGGLAQQKGTLADMLRGDVKRQREEYIPQEKMSRYGGLGVGKGGADPTAGFISGVGKDVGAYGTAITGIDKSIMDILEGTGEGSIFDVRKDYEDIVKQSLFGQDGGLWYT